MAKDLQVQEIMNRVFDSTNNKLNVTQGAVTGDLTVDGDLDFTGPQSITTSSGDLTLAPFGEMDVGTKVVRMGSTSALGTLRGARTSAGNSLGLYTTNAAGADTWRMLINGGADAVSIQMDADLAFTGPQKISTSSGNLTLDPAGGTNIGVPATANSTNGAMTVEGYLDVEGYAAFGNGTAAQANVGLTLDFDVTTAYPRQMAINNGLMTMNSNGNVVGLQVAPGTITVNASTTAASVHILEVATPTITLAGSGGTLAVVTEASTLYIQNAPTASAAGNNYALFVDAGTSRFDGDVGVGVAAPVNVLHAHGSVDGAGYIRITDGNTGATASDGVRMGYNGGVFRIDNRENSNIDFMTNGGNLRWSVLAAGELQSNGAGTIKTSSGDLTLDPVEQLILVPQQVTFTPPAQATTDTNFVYWHANWDTNPVTTNGGNETVAGIRLDPPDITAGTATPTHSTTLLIVGAPDVGSTAKYALWVADGQSRFDNDVAGKATLDVKNSGTAGTNYMAMWNDAGGQIGSITHADGNVTAYNTSSDYRIKENVVAMTGAMTRVKALKPSRFNFIKHPGKTIDGFLAHEVAEVVPSAVAGVKDGVDSEGDMIVQGMDASKLVPLLTAAIQEMEARIVTLEGA